MRNVYLMLRYLRVQCYSAFADSTNRHTFSEVVTEFREMTKFSPVCPKVIAASSTPPHLKLQRKGAGTE